MNLMMFFLTVKYFLTQLYNQNVLIRTDNTNYAVLESSWRNTVNINMSIDMANMVSSYREQDMIEGSLYCREH